MSTITWLHLSDWHQKGHTFDRDVVVRDALVDDIARRTRISPSLARIDFIVFTGDLTFSGQLDEYLAATEHLLDPVLTAAGLADHRATRLFIVPGNHDLDREVLKRLPGEVSQPNTNRERINELIRDEWTRKDYLAPFQQFGTFLAKYLKGAWASPPHSQAYYFTRILEIGDRKVAVAGLNSAWLSSRIVLENEPHDYGFLAIGEPPLYAAQQSCRDADVRIAAMHHPLSWLCEDDRVMSDERLSQCFHFILHGHEHMPRVNVVRGTLGDLVVIPAGASYERRLTGDPRYVNAYNFVSLDFQAGQGSVFLRRWKEQGKRWDEDTDSAKGGRFTFRLPTSITPEKHAASDSIVRSLDRQLNRRVCEDVHVGLAMSLEVHGDVTLTKIDAVLTIKILEGNPEVFGIGVFCNDSASKFIQSKGLNLCACQVEYVRLNNTDIPPTRSGQRGAKYDLPLDSNRAVVEYRYTVYDMAHGVFDFRIDRFVKHLRLDVRDNNELEFEYMPNGGFPPKRPEAFGTLGIKSVEIDEWLHPFAGYSIRWRPARVD